MADEHPMRKERVEVDEHRIVKAFALQKTTAMTMPSASVEEMALIEFFSWGGDEVTCCIRFPALRDLRDGIDQVLATVDEAD